MNLMIKDFKEGDEIIEQFAISSITKSSATSGRPYFRLVLKDASGTINAVKWNINESDNELCVVGNVILVKGKVDTYKSALQMDIEDIAYVPEESIDPSRFVKPSPIPKDKLIEKLKYFINLIKDHDCKAIVSDILKSNLTKFETFPAAVSVHHDFSSGLLYHTISMAEIAEFMADHYSNIDKDLLLSGVLLHDVGKTIEFEGTTSFKYSLEGKLLGHISIVTALIDETAKKLNIDSEKPLLIKHMVLSHHGEYEFGSPVLPQTREAILLNLIDNLDSKMAIVDKALEDVKPGDLSQKVFALDGRVLYKQK